MTVRIVLFLASVFLIISPPAVLLATNWYVDASVGASGDGKSWGSAFKTIQQGIDAATDGDTVIVAEGVYYEEIQFKARNICLTSRTPQSTSVRDATVIDGRGLGYRIPVRFTGWEDETCVLKGFTIRNGFDREATGGILGNDTHATIENNAIGGNLGGSGGGMWRCHGTIQYNVIAANAADYGGGLYMCNGTIQHNTILGNFADRYGGGLYRCSGTIRSNLIVGNMAHTASGGGMYDCDGSVENNTIVQNDAWSKGGGLHECHGVIRNCVIWANTADSGPQLHSGSMPTYSCIQGWSGGEGNTSLDPVFVDPDGADNDPNTYYDNNYRLQQTSPCIDKGKNQEWMRQSTDRDGNPRIFYGLSSATVDMGAYEYGSFPFKVVIVRKTPDGGTELIWRSRPGDIYVVWSRPRMYYAGPIHVPWGEREILFSNGFFTSWTDPGLPYPTLFYRVELKP